MYLPGPDLEILLNPQQLYQEKGKKGVGGGGGNGGGDGKRKRGEKEGNKIWNTLGQRGTEVETEQGTSVRKNIFGGFKQEEQG